MTIIHTAGSFITVSALLKGFSSGTLTLWLYSVLSSTNMATAINASTAMTACPYSI